MQSMPRYDERLLPGRECPSGHRNFRLKLQVLVYRHVTLIFSSALIATLPLGYPSTHCTNGGC